MALAVEEGRRGLGCTSPNPPVGAVIVVGGEVLGTGFHRRAGGPHAEIEAIRSVRRKAGTAASRLLKGATLYVTLEPCSTEGRTPPCTRAIIDAGFKRVVFGARDPNPKHAGRAARVLRAGKVLVSSGVLAEECGHLIRMFRKLILTNTPYVIAKSALTLDGRITAPKGASRWITGPEARRDVHALRATVDAILVGGETVRRDNPRLTVRGNAARRGRPQPWRVVMTRTGRMSPKSHLLNDIHKDRTLVFRGKSLRQVLRDLGRRGVSSTLLESGGDLMGQAFKQQLVDEVRFYLAPSIGGGDVRAVEGSGFSCRLRNMTVAEFGSDLRISGFPVYPDKDTKTRRVK